MRHPFSRSYGVNLPSSLTRDHSSTLAHLCPATSVGLRYGRSRHPHVCFSWRRAYVELPLTGFLLPRQPTRRLAPAQLDAESPTLRSTYHTPHTPGPESSV